MSTWWASVVEAFTRCFIKDDRYMLLVNGIGVTIKVSLLAALLGVIIGFIIAICKMLFYLLYIRNRYKWLNLKVPPNKEYFILL